MRNPISLVLNDAPYGNERPYKTGSAWAWTWSKAAAGAGARLLIGDGVNCAGAGQRTPEGYYNVERMLKSIARRGEVAT